MSNEYLVIPFVGKGSVGATAVQVSDGFGTNLPMRISKDNVDFDGISLNGADILTAAPAVADITDLTASATELNIMTGATVTTAEVNYNDTSVETETITAAGALSAIKSKSKVALVGAGAVTLAAPNAAMYGRVKIIEMTADNGDVTLALTNVQGQSSGTTATFNDVGDTLVLVAGTSKWTVIGEAGISLS